MWNDDGASPESGVSSAAPTSIDKALDLCEALSQAPRGLTVSDLRRLVGLPGATVHRLLAVLKRRGYVQQDEETTRYRLSLKMLDLSFRILGRSELRLHTYPVLRDYVLRTGWRAFLASSPEGEVTYVWATGPDAVAMHTHYGKAMPAHCSLYFTPGSARRLSCLKLERRDFGGAGDPADLLPLRLGAPGPGGPGQHLACTCAPVIDYAGREVARVGVFAHDSGDETLTQVRRREATELARLVSLRLGAAHTFEEVTPGRRTPV